MRSFGLSWEAREALRVAGYTGNEDLSGLISAVCSTERVDFDRLEPYTEGRWVARADVMTPLDPVMTPHYNANEVDAVGDTPEDAVANLWIALNRKDA